MEINSVPVEHFPGSVFLVGEVFFVDVVDVPLAFHPRLLDVGSLETFEAGDDAGLARRPLAGAIQFDFGLDWRRHCLVRAVALHVGLLSHLI